jgi:hypothetical protein
MEPKVNVVPGFILKLWKMVNDPNCNDLISWSDNGQSFIIIDPPRFSNELSKYFKHNNLSSFIRQLNMYGFRKVATIENSGLHPGTEDLHFYHPEFIKGHKDKLENIKRKLPQKLAETVDLKNVYQGISEIDERQKDVSKTLSDLRRENEMLWQELHDLRQKHHQQELYITRLMKLVFEAMEQNGIKANMLQVRTSNPPLMIEGGDGTSVESPQTLADTRALIDGTTTLNDLATSPGQQQTTTTTAQMAAPSPSANLPTNAGDSLGTPNPSIIDNPIHYITQTTSTMSDTTPMNTIDTFQQRAFSPNSQLQSQIDSTDYQIDNLVPEIGEFCEEDLANLFDQ